MHWITFLALGIAVLTVVGILIRPWRSSEWMWAVGGAIAELALGIITVPKAWAAIVGGADVYAFLVGILVLAELARSQGVFDWLAGHADEFVDGSRRRLLLLVYAVGVVVTATLSNDTAIIVLTPAAVALGRRIGGSPLPYLFACAFVANAASFLLPTGNPANLLLYGNALPPLLSWVGIYGAAALVAIVVTYGMLAWSSRDELKQPSRLDVRDPRPRSTRGGRLALGLLIGSALALLVASTLSWGLGITALACAALAVAVLMSNDRSIARYLARGVTWSIVPLVAGLLVIVAALESLGVSSFARSALSAAAALAPLPGRELAGLATAVLANVANNLPVAAFAARALVGANQSLGHAVLVGIDVGPNLSLSGSLATMLWILILRREGIIVTPTQFLTRGALVLAPALIGALLFLH